MWFSPGPLSDEWPVPDGSGPKFLLRYMKTQQVKTYGRYYQDLPSSILLRNIKLLCEEFEEDLIKRAIAQACLISEYPFSTKFIRTTVQWLLEQRSSPIQLFYQNKS